VCVILLDILTLLLRNLLLLVHLLDKLTILLRMLLYTPCNNVHNRAVKIKHILFFYCIVKCAKSQFWDRIKILAILLRRLCYSWDKHENNACNVEGNDR